MICFLGLVSLATGALGADPLAWWKFDEVSDGRTPERGAQRGDPIAGNFKLVPGVAGKALKFDGFTAEIVRPAASAPRLTDSFTIEAWVALGAYPWNWCPLIEQSSETNAGYSLAIGPRGQFRLGLAAGGKWRECMTKDVLLPKDFLLPLRQWTHVAASFERGKGLAVYVNGAPAGSTNVSGAWTPAAKADLRIGVIPAPAKPSNIHREHGTLPGWFSLDGIVDELKIHPRALSPTEVQAAFAAVKPSAAPDLPLRKMPAGAPGPGRFGASYCRLKYYDEWDALWRVGDDPDVLVRFDESAARVVFWRGTRYSAAWVSENDLWMADQSVEAWGVGKEDKEGCFEHMQDPKCLYSHVRIIESNDARVVVHWRYAPVSSRNHLWRVDPKTGYACWVDEYYTIYPDAAGVRKVTWQRGSLGEPRQFQESLPFTQPGQICGDVVEKDFCTVANLKGERVTLSFVEKPAKTKAGAPNGLSMQILHFTSRNDPFIIFESGNYMEYATDQNIKELSGPGGCNHWPVGQLPCDGRTSQASDHPAHFLSFPISNPPIHNNDTREWWNGLYGMTEGGVDELLPLARSWNYPAELTVKSAGFRSAGYDRGQRAFLLARKGASETAALELELSASEATPVFNPAIVIEGWGETGVSLRVDDREIPRGKDFRFGYRETLEGANLIVWLKLNTQKPIRLVLTPLAQ